MPVCFERNRLFSLQSKEHGAGRVSLTPLAAFLSSFVNFIEGNYLEHYFVIDCMIASVLCLASVEHIHFSNTASWRRATASSIFCFHYVSICHDRFYIGKRVKIVLRSSSFVVEACSAPFASWMAIRTQSYKFKPNFCMPA